MSTTGASAFLFHNGRIWRRNQPVDLGEMDAPADKTEISSSEDSYLILTPAKCTPSEFSGNNLHIKLREVPSWCAKTGQYKVQWNLYPKNFGPGKFEDQFELSFDGPVNNGYPPVVTISFRTVVIGLVHGAASAIEIDKNAAKVFLSGNGNSLSFQIRNAGDRNLSLTGLDDLSSNPKEIRFKRTDCQSGEITPASSCTVELELRSKLPKPAAQISYGLVAKTNDVGASTAEFRLEYDGKADVKTYIKL